MKATRSRLKRGGALAAIVVALVGGFEGLRTVAYLDPVGIPTICFGATRGVALGQRKTKAECEALLIDELVRHEVGMRRCLARPDALPEPVYAAFLSLTYNVGVGAFCGSTLARLANAGDLAAACNQLPRWDKALGRRWPGLTRRRAAERKLCLEGVAP